jgi:hypothetical protein
MYNEYITCNVYTITITHRILGIASQDKAKYQNGENTTKQITIRRGKVTGRKYKRENEMII